MYYYIGPNNTSVSNVGSFMSYGGYSLKPVPLITLQKQLLKSGKHADNIGATFTLTLKGTLTPYPDSLDGGLVLLDTLQDELRTAFNQDGKNLLLKCNGTTILSTCPRVLSIEFEESTNNWVFTTLWNLIKIMWAKTQKCPHLSSLSTRIGKSRWSKKLESLHGIWEMLRIKVLVLTTLQREMPTSLYV